MKVKEKQREPFLLANPYECGHQFFKIADETQREGEMVSVVVRWGVIVLCCLCAQRRVLWTDGEIEVL